jgi:hypothetical protein
MKTNSFESFEIYVFKNDYFYQLNITSKIISKPKLIRTHWNYNNLVVLANDIDSAYSIKTETNDEYIDHFIKVSLGLILLKH